MRAKYHIGDRVRVKIKGSIAMQHRGKLGRVAKIDGLHKPAKYFIIMDEGVRDEWVSERLITSCDDLDILLGVEEDE